MTPDEKSNLEQMKMQVDGAEADVGELESEMYGDVGPKGKFSEKAMNGLIDSTNRILPLFGMNDKFPKVSGDSTEFPPEFVRLLAMIGKAVDDAIEGDILTEDAKIAGSSPKTDGDLLLLSGRLNMAAKSKPFSKFLSKPKADAPPPEETAEEEMIEEDPDKLFMERM